MSTCANCSAELRPEWKFCIHCGTPVPAVDVAAPAIPQVLDSAAPVAPSAAVIPAAIRPRPSQSRPPRNSFAVVALIFACIGGVPAIIFGHVALRQLKTSGERGVVMARIATMLGYIWLIAYIFLFAFLLLNG